MTTIGMISQGGIAPQPPYVRFERRAVEKRQTMEAGGGIYYVDVDFALVTPHGSKDTVEKIVVEWFEQLRAAVRQDRYPQLWLDAFKSAYEAWKNDQEPPVMGHDIRNWPVASAAEVKNLLAHRITSVETLATANEDLLMRIGMGARGLKQRALDWLQMKESSTEVISQLAALRETVARQESIIEGLRKRTEMAEGALQTRMAQTAEVLVPSSRNYSPPADRGEDIDAAIDQEVT